MQPIKNKVFIKPITSGETKTASGLILPSSIVEPDYQVVLVGNQCQALKVGDKIRLYEHAEKQEYLDGFFIKETMGVKVVL